MLKGLLNNNNTKDVYLGACMRNGIVMFSNLEIDYHVYIDASLGGMWAYLGKQAYTLPMPESMKNGFTIVHYEMINVVVALRVWAEVVKDSHMVVHCDKYFRQHGPGKNNASSAGIISTVTMPTHQQKLFHTV